MPRYTLALVRVFVTDFPRALAFYRDTLGMPVAYANEAMNWAELGTEGAHLALERSDPDEGEESGVGRFVGVSLRVDDIHAVHEELVAKGVTFVSPPEKQPWGGFLAHLRDPDGNVLTLLGRG